MMPRCPSLLALFSLLLLLPSSGAGAVTRDQQNCITTSNKNLQKVATSLAKEVGACLKDDAKGKLGAMTAGECMAADRKGKVAKATDKTRTGYAKKCSGDDRNGGSRLPDFGVTDPNHVNAVAVEKEMALVELLFGSDLDAALVPEAVDKDASKCQQAVTKSLQKCQDAQLKEFNKCKKLALKAGASDGIALEACMLDDPKGKVAKKCDLDDGTKVDKIRKDLDKKCVAKGVDLAAAFPGCGSGTASGLHDCLTTRLRCLTCTALNDADALGRDCDLLDDGTDDDSCASGISSAAAREIVDPQDLIGGPLARGRTGDFLLENNRVRVIIQKPGRDFSAGVGQFGGNIIDADLQRGPGEPGHDLFEEWSFLINLENTANYTSIVVLHDGSDGGPAIVRATGPDDLLDFINASSVVTDFGFPYPADLDDKDQPVEVTTDYVLERGENLLRIETTVVNTSPTETLHLFLGDFLSSLAQEVFEAGYGFGQPVLTTSQVCDPGLPCDFVAYSQEGPVRGGVSYGYVQTTPGSTLFNQDGVQVSLLGVQALQALIGLAQPNVDLAPGESKMVTRYLVIGDGDVADVMDARNRLAGLATGTVKGRVTVGGDPLEDAEVSVLGPFLSGPGTTRNVVSQFRTDSDGRYQGTLPPADYEIRVNKEGYAFGTPDPAVVSLGSGDTVVQDFTLTAPGTVEVSVTDPNGETLGAKVSLVGFDPSPDPGITQTILGLIQNKTGVFGDITKDAPPWGLTRVVFVDPNGQASFAMEPGDYRVVVSHGPEYSVHAEEITVTSGGVTSVNATVAHVVDTTGFVSGDFHVHSFDSVDCAITREERVLSMIAEGVDFFTPSDHGFRVDFAPVVASLGVQDLISTAVNNEITTFDYGHFGAFPMTFDPNRASGGAVDWAGAAPAGEDFPSLGHYGLSPGEIFDAAAADPGEELIQIHHVHSFFDGGLRVDTGVAPPESTGDPSALRLDPAVSNFWDNAFNALEVWIQTERGQNRTNFLGQNAGNWFNLLNQGLLHPGTADSDTHNLVLFQSGSPRNLIASPTDDPGALAAIAETLALNVNDGRSIGTNSPFLRVTVDGDPNQEAGLELGLPTLVRATGGEAEVTVNVQSPTWAEFDRVEYYVNSETVADPNDRGGLPPLYRICPDHVQTAPADFTVSTVPVNGASRLEAATTLLLSGLTQDAWVVVMVKGTDGVSCPLFPVVPNDLNPATNTTLAEVETCDVGSTELGTMALAFSNPIFIDVDGNGVFDPPGLAFQSSCP